MSLADRLAAAGCVSADEEADELERAADGNAARLEGMAQRREQGEPLAWITGSIDFGGVRVQVTPGVYVPRLQSLPLAQRAVHVLPVGGTAVDLCTGSGALAAYVCAQRPDARLLGADIDIDAVTCAQANGLEAHQGELFDAVPRALEGELDVIMAVAPYVPTDQLQFLPRDVQAYEPLIALDGGADGLAVVRAIVRGAPAWLRPGGWLLLEVGGDQPAVVGPLLDDAGFVEIDTLVDDEGDERGVSARLP